MTAETRTCQNCKSAFIIEPEDFDFYEKVKVPPPTFCPECRAQRRMTWRNERSLYKRECGLCKKSIISIYKPQSPYTVYCHTCFRSDDWDPLAYEREYDFSKPFFLQFSELQKTVPRLYAMVTECVDSEYVNGAAYNKNCYLIFASDHDEDSAYSHSIFYCKNVFDCLGVHHGEYSIGSIDCEKINTCFYSQDCIDSYSLYLCKNCSGCHDCVGCVNLRNRSFCIFNEEYGKEEYYEKLGELRLGSYEHFTAVLEKARSLSVRYPVKYYHGKTTIRSIGDYLINTKNCSHVFDGQELEDCKYLYIANKVKDSYDGYAIVENVERNLEVISHNSSFSKFCLSFWSGSYGTYSDTCENCTNVFGCIGLRNKQYCVLNKQYSKEEYETLVQKIADQMNAMPFVGRNGREYRYGEYFPSEISPYAYNETVAQEFFPLKKDTVATQGYTWFEPETKSYGITRRWHDIPDDIATSDAGICGEILECAHQGKCDDQCITAFRILQPEFELYRKMNLPLPRLCSNCRHYERMKRRNPLKLWRRICQCVGVTSSNGVYKNTATHAHGVGPCPNEFETTYAPGRPEIVYCEQCYQSEVV